MKKANLYKILAIDPATRTGWAISKELHGMENYSLKSGESSGFKLIKFKAFLERIIATEKINLVVYERPGGRFKNDIMSHAKFIAIIETVCLEHKVEYRAYSPAEIKLHATGKGNASKKDMILAAIKLYKMKISDDNIADALLLLSLAKKELEIE